MQKASDIDGFTGQHRKLIAFRTLAFQLEAELAKVKASAFDQHEALIKTLGALADELQKLKAEQKQ